MYSFHLSCLRLSFRITSHLWPIPFASFQCHLNSCWAVWWVPSCLPVSPMKQPTICSAVQNTLETRGTYGWGTIQEKERWPDERLLLPSGMKTGLFLWLWHQRGKTPANFICRRSRISLTREPLKIICSCNYCIFWRMSRLFLHRFAGGVAYTQVWLMVRSHRVCQSAFKQWYEVI